jgi:hypothetical protein
MITRRRVAVQLDPERVRAEDERVLPVVERVEEDLDRIGIGQAGVSTALADDDVVGGSSGHSHD